MSAIRERNHNRPCDEEKPSVTGWFHGIFYWCGAVLGPIGTGLLIVILIVVLFYQEENWRGRRAWAREQAAAAASGKVTDWKAFIPPRVPNDQNFFAAPHMQDWFTGRGSRDISKRMDWDKLVASLQESNCVFAKVTIVARDAIVAPSDADIVLSFEDPKIVISNGPDEPSSDATKNEVIPLIAMRDVPLTNAIKNLAKAAGIRYTFDFKPTGRLQKTLNEATVGLRWTNLTGRDALDALLANYNLRMVPSRRGKPARILYNDDSAIQMDTQLSTQLQQTVYDAMQHVAGTNDDEHLKGAWEIELSAKKLGSIKPVRVAVRADSVPDKGLVVQFFPPHVLGVVRSQIQAKPAGSNVFEVYASLPARVSAEDFLKWSDQFVSDFAAIRAAARRPYARMQGDYSDPAEMPIPNFVTLRLLAQTLSQRAQCHLLLHEPEKATDDLLLIREICRSAEAKPTGKPMTLIAAMIDTAITGLYLEVVGEGFQLNAWREPELAALESQLAEIELVSLFAGGMDCERVGGCWTVEHMTAQNYKKMVEKYGWSKPHSELEYFKDPVYQTLFFGPSGWKYQNMALIARFHMEGLGGVDRTNKLMVPHVADAANKTVQKAFDAKLKFVPFISIAALVVPNFMHASQTVAQKQTLANQARIACALERYRLAHGSYPETLDALAPRWIEALPRDVIGGRPLQYERKGDRYFLGALGWDEKTLVDWPYQRK